MWASYMHHPKCEIAGLGSLKGVLEAFCKLKSINLRTDTIKMLGVPFSYSDTQSTKCNNFENGVFKRFNNGDMSSKITTLQ